MNFMMEGAVFAGFVSFAAAGLMWYLYFYRKEKKLLQRLYDIIEQAEKRSFGEYANAGSEYTENDTSVINDQTCKPQKKSARGDAENSSEDKNLEHKISEGNGLEHKISGYNGLKNGLEHEISEEKVSMIEDKFRRFVNGCLLENENNRRQKQVIQELISDISHQTLTPIANLKLYTELLRESVCDHAGADGADDAQLPELADTLCGQTEKLDFLIQSLVKLSRMETGLIGVHVRAGKIQNLFDAVYGEYRKKAVEKGIALTFEESSLRALFDFKWTVEALGNIVDNAVKYTQVGGKVCVSARAYTFFVRIDVVDNGTGIAQEDFHRIFTRFYRSPSTDDLPGVGIGLYLAREIVQSQRGYIKVASKEGEGSQFSVFLPSADGFVTKQNQDMS